MKSLEQTSLQLNTLRKVILDDIFKDFNQASKRWIRRFLEPLAWLSVHRFTKLAIKFDLTVSSHSFKQALRDFVANFVVDISISGSEHIPKTGPLLIVSNHPGTIDSIAIGANLPRDDLNIIAIGYPLLRSLPYTRRHLIFIDPYGSTNFNAVRSTIRHLRSGGSVLIFPSGRVEPDPSLLPDAGKCLNNWSPSIELFLHKVPETKVITTIVSGVLSPIFLQNPVIRFWRGLRDPLVIAMGTQVISQMIFKNRFRLSPKITFDFPQTVDELRRDYDSIYQALVEKAGRLMDDHLSAYYPIAGSQESRS